MTLRPAPRYLAVFAALTLTLAGCSSSSDASHEATATAPATSVSVTADTEGGGEGEGGAADAEGAGYPVASPPIPIKPADPKRTRGASGKGTASANFFAYSFNPGLILASKSNGVFTHDVLTPVDATIGIPEGDSPKPVVYILHGTHYECLDLSKAPMLAASATSYDWADPCANSNQGGDPEITGFLSGPTWVSYQNGLSYFANALTQAGYVTVSIDTGTMGNFFLGESGSIADHYAAILKVHQGILADLKQGKNHGLTVPANTSKVLGSERFAIVGHSTGGGFALNQALLNADPNMFAAVGLQPALDVIVADPAPPKTAKVPPSLAVFGTCDEDIRWDIAQEKLPEAVKLNPAWPLSALSMKGGTHAGLNAALDQKNVLKTASEFDGCNKKPGEGGVMPVADMQAGYLGATLSFLQQADKGEKNFTVPTTDTVQYLDHAKQNIALTLAPGTLPKVDLGTPKVQQIDEAIIPAWDPKAQPLSPQVG